MTNYNFLIMFGLLIAGILIGVGVALWLRRYPGTEKNVSQALLLVALALRATFDDAEVDAVAGWVFDNTMVSQYYSREDWLKLVRRVFNMLPQRTALAAQQEATAKTDQMSLPL